MYKAGPRPPGPPGEERRSLPTGNWHVSCFTGNGTRRGPPPTRLRGAKPARGSVKEGGAGEESDVPTQRSRLRIRLHRPAGAGNRRGGEASDEPALQHYLREIGAHPTLSREEEASVARRVQRHRRARREILLGIPFVADFVVR